MMMAQKTDGTQILDTFLEQLYWLRTAYLWTCHEKKELLF